MGTSSINGPFSMAMLNNQRVNNIINMCGPLDRHKNRHLHYRVTVQSRGFKSSPVPVHRFQASSIFPRAPPHQVMPVTPGTSLGSPGPLDAPDFRTPNCCPNERWSGRHANLCAQLGRQRDRTGMEMAPGKCLGPWHETSLSSCL